MKPKILFVTEKYTDGNPNNYESPYDACLIGPLEACGMADISTYYYDTAVGHFYEAWIKGRVHALIEDQKPQLVVVTHLLPWANKVPEPEFWAYMREQSSALVCMVWVESSPDVIREAERFRPHVDFSIVTCHPTLHLAHTQNPEHYLFAPEPRDPRVFYELEPLVSRDIIISLIGTAVQRIDRIGILANLWANNIPVYKGGGKEGGHLTTAEFASLLRRSQMTINTTADGGGGVHKLTGRTVEAMLCGALLLESANDVTSQIFEPFVEYVPFLSIEDLILKYRWYSNHEAEARKIAERGRAAALAKRTGKEFWTKVFERAGI